MKSQHIDEQEFLRALGAAGATRHPERDRLCLLLSGRAGMRVGEIRGLDVHDVVDGRGQIKDRVRLVADRTKSRLARDVFLNEEVQSAIAGLLPTLRGEPTGALIRTQSGDRFSHPALVYLFKRVYAAAGLPGAGSHSGRALFIQSLDDRRVPLRVIMKAVGHRHLSSTDAYVSARPSEVKAAVGRLAEGRGS